MHDKASKALSWLRSSPARLALLPAVLTGVLGTGLAVAGQLPDFAGNIVAEVIGLSVGFAIVWWLVEEKANALSEKIDRQTAEALRLLSEKIDHQTAETLRLSKKIDEDNARRDAGLRGDLSTIRNFANNSIAYVVSLLFDKPEFKHQGGPGWYVEEHPEEIRRLLGLAENQLNRTGWITKPNVPERRRRPHFFTAALGQFEKVAELGQRTLKLYGDSVAIYPDVLRNLDRFASSVAREKGMFDGFMEAERERYRDWEQANQGRILRPPESMVERWQPFKDLVPEAAFDDLANLSVGCLAIVAAISLVLKDREPLPSELDTRLTSTWFEWTSEYGAR